MHQRIQLICLVLIAITLPFSTRYNSFFIIILSINWLLKGNFIQQFEYIKKNKTFLVLSSFYLLNVLGMLYTSNYANGGNILLKRISLILFPLILADFRINKKDIDKVCIFFVSSNFIAISFSIYKVYFAMMQGDTSLGSFEGYYQYNYYREILAKPLLIHPTYFSIFILFSIYLIIYLLISYKWYKNILILLCSLLIISYMFAFSLLLSARMPLIAFAFISIIFLMSYLLRHRWYLTLLTTLAVFIYSGFWLLSQPIFNHRFVEIMTTEWKPPVGIHHNSTNIRIGILTCSYEEIKRHWFLGTGTGDMQDALNKCYQTNNYSDVLYKLRYNTHNAYIDALLMLGIIGLFTLIGNFIYNFRLAFKTKNYIFLILNLLFVIICITESLLNSQKGIVFFAFFNTIFSYYSANTRLKKLT